MVNGYMVFHECMEEKAMSRLVLVRLRGALSALSRSALGFGKDERGASMVEYALMVVAIIVVVGAGVAVLQGGFDTLFADLTSELAGAVAAVSTAAS